MPAETLARRATADGGQAGRLPSDQARSGCRERRMSRPTRATAASSAYLDLQNRVRAEGRGTRKFLTLYVVERWLARLSTSPYADQFVLKGGMLLAAYDARRPTADLDARARSVANDEAAMTRQRYCRASRRLLVSPES
jgi:nucleotidyltransferase AbiEii toxin of type IV toxin-antitoxin system